jgi:thymidylate kinase
VTASLVDCLIEALNQERVRYCSWKSNIDLDQALTGQMDLDFLVDRESYLPALSVLARLGFKPAGPRWGGTTPGIAHFYGYDPAADRLAHVHLFSRVITGESFLKSHMLPFEDLLLENPRYSGSLPVASYSAELVIFVLRAFIKYGSPLDLLVLRRQAEKLRKEARWLHEHADREQSLDLLRRHCPVVDEDLFLRCLQALENGASLSQRIALARQVRGRLRAYARHTALEWAGAMARLAVSQLQRRLGARRKNKVFHAGGRVIAVVGGDGAGKSTLVSELGRWLGRDFTVRVVHAGKPPASLLTAPLNLALRLLRRGRGSRGEGLSPNGSGRKGGLLYALRAVALAYDRRSLLRRAWQAAAKGDIVLVDRYPTATPGLMDSPRLAERPGDGRLYRCLVRLERELYAQIPPPDVVLRLQVSVETALQRNRARAGGEPDDYIQARHQSVPAWQRPDAGQVHDVSAERPLEAVLLEIKDLVWQAL